MVRYDPWGAADERNLDCLRDPRLPAGRGDSWWLPWLRLIILRDGLHPVHERCVLTHEVVHVDHCDVQLAQVGPDGPRLSRRQEHRADQEAARRLVSVDDLAVALLAHPTSPRGVAHELEVTVEVLQQRLEHLVADERSWLEQRLAGCDDAA